jgi:hypothetical protein
MQSGGGIVGTGNLLRTSQAYGGRWGAILGHLLFAGYSTHHTKYFGTPALVYIR